MGREGCLKEDICCDRQLEMSGVLTLENKSKKKDYDRNGMGSQDAINATCLLGSGSFEGGSLWNRSLKMSHFRE